MSSVVVPVLLGLVLPVQGFTAPFHGRAAAPRVAQSPCMTLAASDEIVVCGNGPIMILSAKLAAIKGHPTTLCISPQEITQAPGLIYNDEHHPEGSLPIKLLTIAGPDADADAIEAACASAKGLVVAFDGESVINEAALNVFMPEGGALDRVAVMSRYLNGDGMGFFANAAKIAANSEIWAGGKAIEAYKNMERFVAARAQKIGGARSLRRIPH